jgi:hypothetical protein
MNIRAHALAKQARCLRATTVYHPLPINLVNFYIQDTPVHSNYSGNVRKAYHSINTNNS